MTPNRSTRRREKKSKVRAHKLLTRACSSVLADDIAQRAEPYPAELMALSRAKVLTADPTTQHNYNPEGTRGEHRYTPKIAVRDEDTIDTLTTAEADRCAELYGWTSSAGVVVNGAALRRANG